MLRGIQVREGVCLSVMNALVQQDAHAPSTPINLSYGSRHKYCELHPALSTALAGRMFYALVDVLTHAMCIA